MDKDRMPYLNPPYWWEEKLHPGPQPKPTRKRGQSRRASIIEVFSGTAFGFFIATWANVLVLPIFGYDITSLHAIAIGAIFTGISLLRGYLFRRLFEWLRTTGLLP